MSKAKILETAREYFSKLWDDDSIYSECNHLREALYTVYKFDGISEKLFNEISMGLVDIAINRMKELKELNNEQMG